MDRVFIDTNIPMYAAGTPHILKEPSQRVILAIANSEINAVTNAEVFQELLYRYLHIGERERGFDVFDYFHRIMRGRVLPVEDADMWQARELAQRYPALSPRDLIHLATMLHHQIGEIITADAGFDIIQEIRRIDPCDFRS